MKRVLIADDHPTIRQGIRHILSESPELAVTGEAADGRDVLHKVRNEPCDVVLLDLTLPGLGGLEVLKRIKELRPELPVLILSMHSEDQYAERALRLGASGYVTKGAAPKELLGAIRKVVSGGTYVSPSLAEKLATDLGRNSGKAPHESLSHREHDVMLRIAGGQSLGQIADELCLSVKTISTYRARILDKLRLTSSAELIRYAMREKMVE